MRRVWAILTVLTWLPGVAAGGWSTNWPAWEYPRLLDQQIAELNAAVAERCTAAGIAAPSGTSWYRLNHAELVALKTKMKSLIAVTVNHTEQATNSFSGAWDYWTVTEVCQAAGVPTNYFDYTPYRSLSGLGGATNDVTVGHPYGYTNASTHAGGTNFPGTRSAWYTTDYGVDGVKLALTNLLWWAKSQSNASPTNQTVGTYRVAVTTRTSSDPNYGPCYTNHITISWPASTWQNSIAIYEKDAWAQMVFDFPSTYYRVVSYRKFVTPEIVPITTNFNATAHFHLKYVKFQNYYTFSDFDLLGVAQDQYRYEGSTASSAGDGRVYGVVVNSNNVSSSQALVDNIMGGVIPTGINRAWQTSTMQVLFTYDPTEFEYQ